MILVWNPKTDFEGFIKIEIPSMRERLMLAKELSYDIKEEVRALDNIERMLKILDVCEKYIKTVNLLHVESKKEFKSWNEMQSDSLCDKLIEEISAYIISGGKLGEV